MKKNLIPLLGIAFLVALFATAVFYGLVVSRVSAGSDVPASAQTTGQPKLPDDPALLSIPLRMRAVSVQVADSSGVLAMLKEGDKVDVQAVYTRAGAREVELKTILEEIQVLHINLRPEPEAGRPVLPVVTLLASPPDADALGLADSAARIRLALRNTKDSEKMPRSSIGMSTLVQNNPGAANKPANLTQSTLPPLKAGTK